MGRVQEFDSGEALDKAMGVFWHKGYEATSLNDLLAATGLSKSSLYATFGGKRELFLTAYDAYREERAREMHDILARGSARDAVEAFFRLIIGNADRLEFSNGCMSVNHAVEMAPHDPDVQARVEADFQLIEDALAKTITRGQADGSVGTKENARRLARLFTVAFPGFQVMVRAGAKGVRMRDALATLLANLD
ncbi:HTH-type transcriptional repressor ComR [Paraburkholderia ultramafica]|uniref:HTH-type transcriptional repressor ComR n=1 Tax=Paraburkholderia ultramafica TaxID=1544867 RepID=A0A6S7BLC7_9BURK|nr:TetR/AcrR family transcriptional regulator [Paraburkholderia ultramafica]CAB3803048.1 HTH-type transcriptional repressor ComR [Paraburkholderia ultramafica]